MSLRVQINIYVIVSSLLILLIGSSLVFWQAKNSVEKEVNSSITLAKQLIKLGFSNIEKAQQNESNWLRNLMSLEQTRHLTIELTLPSGEYRKLHEQKAKQKQRPPQWFIKLISFNP